MVTKFTVMGINTALTVIEQCTGILKAWAAQAPDDPTKQDLSETLQTAEESLRLAKSEIAKGYDYPLCQAHFPPGIMVKIKSDREFAWWKCSDCGAVTQLPQGLRQRYPRMRVEQISLEQARVLRRELRIDTSP